MKTKYNPQNIESKWYEYWLKNDVFHSSPDNRKPYVILIPPPNVTGVLHMGHMLNNTLQDVLIRRARLLGFNACWVPGTDHASIATEAKVISKLKGQGIEKEDLSREEFLKHAWNWTDKHGGIILQQLKRLGASCDWSRVKFTMDDDMSESVIAAFVDLYRKGFIYRGQKMINWDPKAKTAISDEEVIYKEQDSSLYYIKYKLVESDEFVTVATTRPETILGDTAICVHPSDNRYNNIIGKKVLVPLVNRAIPIITDEYIDPEFGTGALKVTPAHDINDFLIGEKNKLAMISILDEEGLLNKNAELYIGEDRFVVRKKIIKDIKAINQLEKIESIKNKVGFSERTDVVIEPMLSTQWFMKMEKIAKPALDNVLNGEINFYPKKLKNTYKHWMENIKDWCLSRQLFWGHRIPAFYYSESDYVVAKNKSEALDLIRKKTKNNNITLSEVKQEEDVLDTWFSSWLWPLTVFDGIRNPNNTDFTYYYPTSDLVTGPDILFFWVARMIVSGYEFTNNKPFKNVYFTGIVRDRDRRKMSKSLGNSPDPVELMNEYGADGVRCAMLFASPAGNDLLFDESLCEQGRNFSNKIWNAFLLVDSWEKQDLDCSICDTQAIYWFENKLKKQVEELNRLFSEFRISDCLMILYKLIWDDFCSSYLEIIKPYDKKVSIVTHEKTIYFFEKILICLHPFMPFLSEEIWHNLSDRKENASISLSEWPTFEELSLDTKILLDFDHLFELVGSIRKIRKEKNISFTQSLTLYFDKDSIVPSHEILTKICNLDKVQVFNNDDDEKLFPFLVGTNKYFIPLIFNVDVKDEIQKINNQITYLTGFLNSINKKTSNQNFMNNAPKKVVEMELKKQTDTINKIKSLKEQLNSFDETD
jgi:valyl-tRNA synthetase